MECGDVELDEDDPSSSSLAAAAEQTQSVDELEAFREEWREELRQRQQGSPSRPRGQRSDYQQSEHEPQDGETESVTAEKVKVQQLNTEEEAASLYWLGAAAEKSGDIQAALLYYKRACQLVPDIDCRLRWEDPPQERQDDSDDSDCETIGSEEGDLVSQFQYMAIHSLGWCQPERHTKSTHISSLPLDVVRYIVRWVVSSQLDMRSLEMLSMVCRALYCLAREPALWRAACRRLWKDTTSAGSYGDSWRRMFILKPHLRFNGVYICKTSYVREGERSLDNFYKPLHTVVYYRYLRFLPDGSVMYHTSPGDPAHTVTRLCHKHFSESVLLGDYTHVGSKVVVEVWSHSSPTPLSRHRGRGRGNRRQDVVYEQRFHMELCLQSSSSRRRCNQLTWEEYYCQSLHKSTGHSQTSHFNLDYTYSPFYFSRVKSFTTNSTGMLT